MVFNFSSKNQQRKDRASMLNVLDTKHTDIEIKTRRGTDLKALSAPVSKRRSQLEENRVPPAPP